MSTPPSKSTGHFAADDSAQLVKMLELEILNRRAKRLARGDDDQRQMVRMFGVLLFFGLLLATLGAMWYMQTSHVAGRSALRHPVTAVPAPAP